MLEFFVKSSIFDRSRRLTLDPKYLEFDDNDLVSSLPTRFLKEEIEGIRYGIKAIEGYRFRIGRVYCIDVRANSGKIIKLRLRSLYRVRRNQLGIKYSQILEALFQHFFNELSGRYMKLFRNNIQFEILGVNFNAEGVHFDDKIGTITWDFLGTKKYHTYYALFSEVNPDHYKAFSYIEQWNAAILYSVTEAILKIKFPSSTIRT